MFDELVVGGPLDAPGHVCPGHPERPERVHAVMRGIEKASLGKSRINVEPQLATLTQVRLVHHQSVIDNVRLLSERGGGNIDADTYVTSTTFEDALLMAGAGIAVIEEVSKREHAMGFVVGRPPGHHATKDFSMGFCIFNNVAIAAAYLRDQGQRVAIVDWDVHHGNGTQDIFWETDQVLYVSLHEWPLYPGTGRSDEIGEGKGVGLTLNIPMASGTLGSDLLREIEQQVLPRMTDFQPTWLLVSAGFDAHVADPLAGLCLTSQDFGSIARFLSESTAGSCKKVLFLEGGYDLDALEQAVAEIVRK